MTTETNRTLTSKNGVSESTLKAWQADAANMIESGVATGMIAVCPIALSALCREVMESRSSETERVGWQPITSAPKTGVFLVSIDSMPELAWPAYQTDGCGVHSNAHGILNKQNHYGETLRASYWMPMPIAPALKALAQPPGCGYPACGCADITQCEALKANEGQS